MYQLICVPVITPSFVRLHWELRCDGPTNSVKGIRIGFKRVTRISKSEACQSWKEMLESEQIGWINFESDDKWVVDFDRFRQWVVAYGGRFDRLDMAGPMLYALSWLTGVTACRIEVEYQPKVQRLSELGKPNDSLEKDTLLWLTIYREEFELEKKTRIFLSHKGADKPMVRRFHAVLESLGHAPWLDEEDMAAGAELHRSIQKGMEESCAAVFFLTDKFKDERFLRGEINHAIAQKTERDDRFSIITLVFDTESENTIEVPSPLKPYVWKHPNSELDGLREIIRGLPVTLGPVRWK